MDDDIKTVLLEIASELKERNAMTKESMARSEEHIKATREKLGLKFDAGASIKSMTEQHEERTAKFREESERRHAERQAFESDLIAELRRLNSNFEAFLGRNAPN
jgi:hypothetical protein